MCKGPEAGSACMPQELTGDQCGWSSPENVWEKKGNRVGRQSQSASREAGGRSHIEGGWSRIDFGGGVNRPC